MAHEYDFGDGGKVSLTARSTEHYEMFIAMQSLGVMGARIAHYINNLKALDRNKSETIARLKGEVERVEEIQTEVHQREFPQASQPRVPAVTKPKKDFIFSDSHTPGPWGMTRSGMIRAGSDWICAVTARNRIYNGPLIQVAPDMLAMIERMLSSPSPAEARIIIADAHALVERAKLPAWERQPRAAM